jgi:DNA polymerase-3 subunit alpha
VAVVHQGKDHFMITLGARTDYSFMRGYGTPKQWLARAEEIGCNALAITDYCSTWGHVGFWDAFQRSKTKLIYGVQLPVVSQLEKDPSHDLVSLLAKDAGALKDIYDAISIAQEQTYYRPRLTWAQIAELSKTCHIIVNECSVARVNVFKKIKGVMLGARPVRDRMASLVRSGEFRVVPSVVPVVPKIEDKAAFDLLQAISNSKRIGEVGGSVHPLMRRTDYEGAMRGCGVEPVGAWFDLAARIAEECNVGTFPHASKIKIAKNQKQAQIELRMWCAAGAKRLGISLKAQSDYANRLERELAVIAEKKFEDYFLFVGSLVRWAKGRMFVGPGRGSSSGSLLCYLLDITTIDPLKYGTLFERFIDITRPDWPDIDVDFPDVRRDEVYGYLHKAFGVDHVARLGTVSEFGGKSAINDTAKATGVKYEIAREMGKVIEGYIVSGQQVSSLKTMFEKDPLAKSIGAAHPPLLLATAIEDHARHTGVHAAGVVVTNEPVASFGSVDKHGTIALDMKMAEKIDMIKMDVLGLRTLSVMQDVCDQVAIKPASLYNLDFLGGDKKVFEVFNKDRVTGIFQFEGHAVRQLMKQIKVERFDDLAALSSLARPGPLSGGAAALWVDRRSGEVDWDYKHPSLKPHVESTFGTITYQEQAMGIVRDLGGFDEPAVNGFRRAIGKKLPEQLRTYREQFLAGCKTWHERAREAYGVKPGAALIAIPDEIAAELWDEMCEFGSYAFNLAHAVAYAMISYMAAHLKAYHPLEFAVANLRNAADAEQGKQLLRELADEGFEYVPFDPMLSKATWSIQKGKIVGGFDSVVGIGTKTAELLIEKRNKGGKKWMEELTESQREKLTRADNTPWHQLTYFQRVYADLYASPENYISTSTPAGVTAPVYLIKDIPSKKGTYRFLGRIVRKMVKDKNSPEQLAKRGGEKMLEKSTFVNLILADDTGEIGSTINRFKVPSYGWLLDHPTEGKDYLIKADIIRDDGGMRWLFIDVILELTPPEVKTEAPAPKPKKAKRKK